MEYPAGKPNVEHAILRPNGLSVMAILLIGTFVVGIGVLLAYTALLIIVPVLSFPTFPHKYTHPFVGSILLLVISSFLACVGVNISGRALSRRCVVDSRGLTLTESKRFFGARRKFVSWDQVKAVFIGRGARGSIVLGLLLDSGKVLQLSYYKPLYPAIAVIRHHVPEDIIQDELQPARGRNRQ